MFIIITPGSKYRHHTNDVRTAADIILGLTNEDNEYDRSLNIMGNMLVGDVFDSKDKYTILCVGGESSTKNFDRDTALSILKEFSRDMYPSHDLFGNKTLVINRYKFENIRKKYLDN